MVVLSDGGPDAVMATAMLCRLHKVQPGDLLFIYSADFGHSEEMRKCGQKRLLIELGLGLAFDEVRMLRAEIRGSAEGSELCKQVTKSRQATLDCICEDIGSRSHLDFYVLGPCHGSLGAILEALKKRDAAWHSKRNIKVTVSNDAWANTDVEAVTELVGSGCVREGLTVVSPRELLGAKAQAESLAAFMPRDFGAKLQAQQPEFAASLQLLCPVHAPGVPMAAQAVFLCEFAKLRGVKGLKETPSQLHYNKDAALPRFVARAAGGIKGVLPVLEPSNDSLKTLRDALKDMLFDALKNRRQLSRAGGVLIYKPTPESLEKSREAATELFKDERMRDGQGTREEALAEWAKRLAPAWKQHPTRRERKSQLRPLTILYTDLEPDDILATCQLWQWNFEQYKGPGANEAFVPLVIGHFNFKDKEKGTIYEKKLLMAALALGVVDLRQLTYEADQGTDSEHPMAAQLQEERAATLDGIVDEIAAYTGKLIRLYFYAPGHGNLGAIVEGLKARNKWPLNGGKTRWTVSLYSGAFNVKGMIASDWQAFKEIGEYMDEPLVDLAKFAFFGGKEAHPWSSSMSTFAMPDFAVRTRMACPMLAAVFTDFNAEFNARLIRPANDGLFRGSTLDQAEKDRFDEIAKKFDAQDPMPYAQALAADESIFAKTADFKKTTIQAFAHGACDSPLCDQLLFVRGFLTVKQPGALKLPPGFWRKDDKGFLTIQNKKEDSLGVRACQPILKQPGDAKLLMQCRKACEHMFFSRLKAIHG